MLAVLVLALQASPVRAEESGASEAGLGAAAAISSLLYGPIKIAYSTLLDAVVTPAIRGDYVITPSHLRGEKPVEFIGRRPAYREETVVLEEAY
jgi:hypothetical protein